jgi:hypothetical protein
VAAEKQAAAERLAVAKAERAAAGLRVSERTVRGRSLLTYAQGHVRATGFGRGRQQVQQFVYQEAVLSVSLLVSHRPAAGYRSFSAAVKEALRSGDTRNRVELADDRRLLANPSPATRSLTAAKKRKLGRGGLIVRGLRDNNYGGVSRFSFF